MKIVADENIPMLMECFDAFGEVIALPGRHICSQDVRDADALLVRSVTQVNKALVADSSLKFVATATAGFDHIDRGYLTSAGIGFSHAPGCNATAVVEYVMAALATLAERDGFVLQKRKVGIVGKGQVGSRLYQMMERLGITVCACDPLLEQEANSTGYVSLQTLIQQSDVICLHTPLTYTGPYPTHHLISEQELQAMSCGTILINAGRGPVVDNAALKECLSQRDDLTVVLDVWESEPDVDPALMALIDIATPHIAGYSLDGKMLGTQMIHQAFCQHFGLPASLADIRPAPVLQQMAFCHGVDFSSTCTRAIRAVYDICRDDRVMRKAIMHGDKPHREQAFDQLRKHYPQRREFSTLSVNLKDCAPELTSSFKALQFSVGCE